MKIFNFKYTNPLSNGIGVLQIEIHHYPLTPNFFYSHLTTKIFLHPFDVAD